VFVLFICHLIIIYVYILYQVDTTIIYEARRLFLCVFVYSFYV